MTKQQLTRLLEQYMLNKATEQERQELFSIVQSNADEELFKQVVSDLIQKESPAFPVHGEPWQKMVQNIVQIDKELSVPNKKATVFTLYRWVAAAAILLLVSATVYFYMNHNRSTSLATTQSQSAFKVVSTNGGKQQEVILPDGSHVWLNGASSIRYPVSFSDKERSVELTGEAWFDVQHADKIPFVIHSGAITTTVMGTAFDVRAYPDQQTMEVAVERGKVKVESGNTLLAMLQKGQLVKVTADGRHSSRDTIDISYIAGWKQGNLYYKDEMLGDIIADLQRVFNASIQIKRASLKQVVTTASFNKNTNLRKALEIICRINDARLLEDNGTYIIE
jgi:ferric-dicitrate binding protein FerR (iron transport regulator)